jgi:hypothetical protein
VRAWLASSLVCALTAALPAQDSARGVVVGEVVIGGTTLGLEYSVIALPAQAVERFTDAQGRFVLPDVPAGRVLLRAKHLGYLPLDTTIVVTAGDTARVSLGLAHVPAQLPAVRTTATACDYPGSASVGTNTQLASLFEQIKQNAERHRLLSRSYPFEYSVERMLWHWDPDSVGRVLETDTLRRSSDRAWRYRPGHLMSEQHNPPGKIGGRWITMVLPELGDFADDEFLHNHCFDYAGLDSLDGYRLVRIDFVPARTIRTPDISGSLFLDPATFQIRRTSMKLVNPPDQVKELISGQVVETSFTEIVPGVPIFAQTSSTVTPSERVKVIIPEPSLEYQRLINVRFLKGRP